MDCRYATRHLWWLPLLLAPGLLSVTGGHTWTVTYISEARLAARNFVFENHSLKNVTHAAIVCGTREWCKIFCKVEEGRYDLLVPDFISVPFNEDPMKEPFVTCYTNRKKNLLTAQSGITVRGSPHEKVNPSRTIDNLIDGVYTYDLGSCYMAEEGDDTHLVFDLGKIMNVQNVLFIAQPNGLARSYFGKFDIRVGMDATEGDFSSYQQLGYFGEKAPYPNYEYFTNSPKPIKGRYISVQSSISTFVQICHAEIFAF